MAADSIGSTALTIAANIQPLHTGLTSALQGIENFSGKARIALAEATGGMSEVIGMAMKLAAAFTGIALFEKIRGIGEELKEAQREAKAFGVSVQYIQTLNTAGIDSHQITQGFRKISTAVEQLEQHQTKAIRNFRMIGLSVRDMIDKSPEEQMNAVMQALQKMPEGPQRTYAAVQLLGKSAHETLARMKEIERAKVEGVKLGTVMSDGDIAKVADMNKSWRAVNESIKGAWMTLSAALAPVLTTINRLFASVLSWAKPLADICGVIVDLAWPVVAIVIEAISLAFSTMGNALRWIADKAKAVRDALVYCFDQAVLAAKPFLKALSYVIWLFNEEASKSLDEWLERVGQPRPTTAIDNAGQALMSLVASFADVQDAMEKTMRQMDMTGPERQLDDLRQRINDLTNGMTDFDHITADAMQRWNELVDTANREMGMQIARQVDPTIKMRVELERLNNLYRSGAISAANFAIEQNRILHQAEKAVGLGKELKPQDAFQEGSKQAFEVVQRWQMNNMAQQQSPQERTNQILEEVRRIGEAQLEQQRRIGRRDLAIEVV